MDAMTARAAPGDPEDTGAASPPARRTQQQRRSETQHKLCEAALDLLVEVGYERLTTAQIAQRAQVSKGALAHHYPSKDDMLVAAYRHLLARWDALRQSFLQQQGGRSDMEGLMRYLWRDVFGRPDFLASVEMMLAARHHPSLQERLREVLATWTTARDAVFRQVVPLDDPAELADFLQVNFCFLRGLALYGGLAGDPAQQDRALALWAEMAGAYVESRRAAAERRRAILAHDPLP